MVNVLSVWAGWLALGISRRSENMRWRERDRAFFSSSTVMTWALIDRRCRVSDGAVLVV
jgi:hypothetical protein